MTHRIATRAARGDGRRPPAIDRSPEAVGAVLEDAAHFPGGHAEGVTFPRSEAEVAAVVRGCGAILPIGAQSSLTGGATPSGETVVSLARLTRVLEIDGNRARVEPGISLEALQESLDAHGLYYPPAPTFAGASIGGTIATNAAGAATFKYGSTRAWIDGLTAVLASGEVLDLSRGQVRAHPDGYFEVTTSDHTARVPVPTYQMPDVAKRSAGYHAEPGMDLIDLFIGSEGTLGIVTEATLRLIPRAAVSCTAFVTLPDEPRAFALAAALRAGAQAFRASEGREGFDVPAIEYIDARSLALVPDPVLARAGLARPAARATALFIRIDLPGGLTADEAFEQIASFETAGTSLGRLCALLAEHDALERTEIALPGDRRGPWIDAVREAVPEAVNDLVGRAKRDVDASIEKVAGDLVVPVDRLDAMVQAVRDGFAQRGLDLAVWGHVSDGNLHPNLLPRTAADLTAGKEALLELGREVSRLGGCPLAEHGVGRNRVKQELLRQLYGEKGIDEMRAVKRALDPTWKLAPGVIFTKQ